MVQVLCLVSLGNLRPRVTLLPWYAWTMGGRGMITVHFLTLEQFVARQTYDGKIAWEG